MEAVEPPCIMCVQYVRGVQYIRGYHEYIRRQHAYIGRCSIHRRITIMHVGDIMSTLGDVQYIGGLP